MKTPETKRKFADPLTHHSHEEVSTLPKRIKIEEPPLLNYKQMLFFASRQADKVTVKIKSGEKAEIKKINDESAQASAWVNRNRSFSISLKQEDEAAKETSSIHNTNLSVHDCKHASTSVTQDVIYQQALPSENDPGIRVYQYQLAKAANNAGDLVKALEWFNLAALPRGFDEYILAEKQLRDKAEQQANAIKEQLSEIHRYQTFITTPRLTASS